MCDSYIVRLYHSKKSSDKNSASDMVGIIETPPGGQRTAFHDKDELWNALLSRFDKRQNKKVKKKEELLS